MRIPLSWLREMTPVPLDADPADIATDLSDLGLVVEATERVGEGLADVIVARVSSIEAIPGADKIRQVLVDAGRNEPLSIVCGAWNFEEGDLVALAPVGAKLPNGLEIGRRKMKGVFSEGMLCSGRELGLSQDGEGLLVLGNTPSPPLIPGAPLTEALGLTPDVVFVLEISPNRPDCLSVAGVARDLAARLRIPFTLPSPVVTESGPPAAAFASVVVDAPDLCPRLTGRVITGMSVGTSPPQVARRLALCGMRALNSVVDASNYVMLELGQPTHPYDIDLLDGNGIVARAGRPGEEVVTLDGVPRKVGTSDCVIGDATGHPAGIGGIMGGHFCEITAGTTEVLLEAAHFTPLAIARTARRLGMRTEASVRFERGSDPEILELAGDRFCELVVAAARAAGLRDPVVAPGLLDARPVMRAPAPIGVRTSRVNAILGLALTDEVVKGFLEPIGFTVRPAAARSSASSAPASPASAPSAPTPAQPTPAASGDPADTAPAEPIDASSEDESGEGVADVTPPTFRPDVTREEDVVEEVARHFGYGRIPSRHRRAPGVGALTYHQHQRRRLRRVLTALGANDAWTSSFVSPSDHERMRLEGGEVTVANPLTPEESVLRRSLMPGLLRALVHNSSRRNPDIRLFEIGHIFAVPDSTARSAADPAAAGDEGSPLPDERECAAVLFAREDDSAVSAVSSWRKIADILGIAGVEIVDAQVDGLHPTRSGRLVSEDGGLVGHLGEVDPEVVLAYGLPHARLGWLDADVHQLVALSETRPPIREVSRFPSSDIDLAFAVDEAVPAAAVERALVRAAGDLGEWVRLFDVYSGPGLDTGTRSLAYRVRLSASDRTLTEVEIADARIACVTAVEEALPARLRS
jgi:phenylalanyl-tRNA synthetase beta chain